MIEFFPDNLSKSDFDSPGELELYNKFKNLSTRRNWAVFHSQGVHKHVSQLMGEIDYVLIMPKVGVLTVEYDSLARDFRLFKNSVNFFGTAKNPNLQPPAPHHLLNPPVIKLNSG